MKFKTTKTFPHRCNGPILARFRHSRKLIPLFLFTLLIALPLAGRSKEKLTYGEGLIINIPVPESEVEQVVADVAQNGVIRGTKEYNKDEFVAGAKPVESTHVFPAWEQGGKVFYKVREQAIDPRNFKDTSDVGTLAVRYVVQAQGEKNTVLHIDALFKEDYRHIVHQSNGSVENAEYKDIREHLDTIEVMKKQNIEAEKEREEYIAKKQNRAMPSGADAMSSSKSSSGSSAVAASPVAENTQPTAAPTATETMTAPQEAPPAEQSQVPQSQPLQTLEQHVKELRKQVERLVKSPGAPLKSAPFHTAGTLVLLPEGTEVLIVINTPYWYGVETHEGQHGWMQRDELELLP
jgi:hypothetical protein